MTHLTMKTMKMIAVRGELVRQELAEEAQKIVDLAADPNVPPEQKEIARRGLDEMIRKLENRIETGRHVRNGNTP